MKKILGYFEGIKVLLLILYVTFIVGADVFLSDFTDKTKAYLYLLIFAGALVLCPALIKLFRRIRVPYKAVLDTKKAKAIWFSIFLLISAAVFGLYYIGYYPGAFSADSITQYRQAVTGEYSNWHPVLHTLLGFTLPLKLTGGWAGSIVLFQLLAFSFTAAYAAYTMLRYSNIPYAVLSLLFVLLSPATGVISLYPWKDVPFAITATLAATFAANAWFTKGAWLKNRFHIAAAVAVLVLTTVFRHNAVLFTVPMLIAMLLYLNRKAVIITVVCFLSAIILIEGPFYAILKVEQPGDRAEEMLGVPVSVIGAVAARNPEALDDDIKAFIYSVAPAESWTNGYVMGNFNTVKFRPGTDYHKISEAGIPKVIGYTLRCFVKSPKEAFTGFIAATDIVYTVTGSDAYWSDVRPGIVGNEYDIEYRGKEDVKTVTDYIGNKLYTFMKWIFYYVGAMNLLLITAALAKLSFKQKAERKRILPVLSMLLYNFGTMLLLSGDDFRLFYFTFPVTPVLLLLVLGEVPEPSGTEPVEENPELPEGSRLPEEPRTTPAPAEE